MTKRPHDVTDLYLAPVALGLDAELESLAGLSPDALTREIALRTDHEPSTGDERRVALLAAISHLVETHGWRLAWSERGVEMSHDDHRLVLGVPASVRDYVEKPA